MGLRQESESVRIIKHRYASRCRSKRGEASTYKPIVETRNPPVTVLETLSPEHAFKLLVSALKSGGREEMHKFLGLKINTEG
ncbi:MAG: hypothetical protein WBD86_00095 [Microgenomates group bacterium]